jgi:tRNA U54 and U55 pseudouridine synthase Pus10
VIDDEKTMKDEDQEQTQDKLDENQCHICRSQLETKDDLFDHVQANHEEYFDGIMDVAAKMSSSAI